MIPGVPLLAQNTTVDEPASSSISQPALQLQLLQLLLLTSQLCGGYTAEKELGIRSTIKYA